MMLLGALLACAAVAAGGWFVGWHMGFEDGFREGLETWADRGESNGH